MNKNPQLYVLGIEKGRLFIELWLLWIVCPFGRFTVVDITVWKFHQLNIQLPKKYNFFLKNRLSILASTESHKVFTYSVLRRCPISSSQICFCYLTNVRPVSVDFFEGIELKCGIELGIVFQDVQGFLSFVGGYHFSTEEYVCELLLNQVQLLMPRWLQSSQKSWRDLSYTTYKHPACCHTL